MAYSRKPSRKKALNASIYGHLESQFDLEADLQHALARTDDFVEGVMAFLIDQNVEDQVLYAIAVLLHHFGFEEGAHVACPYASPVTFTLHGPESVPP